ncbi:MAG: CapA family protein [Bacillota bacterium]|nr:CapA family protein [Bacillota bacterium]
MRKKAGNRARRRKKTRINIARLTVFLAICVVLAGVGIFALVKLMPSQEAVPASAVPEETQASTITIGNAGDVIIHSPFLKSSTYKKDGDYDFSPAFTYVKDLYESYDFMTINLETTLPGKEAGYSGYPMFKSPDSLASALTANGTDLLLLANNHIYDSGSSGFLRTSQYLAEQGILYTGARHSDEEKKYLIHEIEGIDIGFVNYVYETPRSDDLKGINGNPMDSSVAPYLNSFDPNDREAFYAEMEENVAAMEADGAEFIIAYLHWGNEYQLEETDWQREMAQRLCDMGVDAIIGGHPHVVQPVDVFTSDDGENTMFCAFSVGNQLSNQRREFVSLSTGHTEDGLIVSLEITKDKKGDVSLTGAECVPTWVYKSNSGPTYYVLPLNDMGNLESVTGLSGINSQVQSSYDRTNAIIGEGMEKVKAAYGF